MADASPSLDALRGEIDQIDGEIHALLMRRTQVSRRVARAKGKAPQPIRFAREVQVLRRLLDNHEGPLPGAVLVRIWREIFADSLSQQGPFSVAVLAADGLPSLTGLARDHFGVITPILEQGSAVRVVNAVAEGECGVGLLPPPESDSPDAWWRFLARDGAGVPRIIGRLPLAPAAAPSAPPGQSALVLSLAEPEPSGRDHSFLILEAGADLSRSAAKGLVEKAGLPVCDTVVRDEPSEERLLLMEISDYVGAADRRLAKLRSLDSERIRGCWLAGSYPLPFTEPALVDAKAAAGERTRES